MAITVPADNAPAYTYTQPIRDSISRANELTDDADTATPKRIPVGVLATGTPTGTKYLRDDRTWADPGTGGGSPTSVTHNFQTGTSYTAVLSDAGKLVEQSNAAANTHTVPPNSSVAFPVGTFYHIRQGGAGQTTITAGAGVTFRSRLGTGLTSIKLGGQWAEATVTQRTANEWVVSGEITL